MGYYINDCDVNSLKRTWQLNSLKNVLLKSGHSLQQTDFKKKYIGLKNYAFYCYYHLEKKKAYSLIFNIK